MPGLYVASNVNSLVSQNQLNRSMAGLSDILTRLSTGLRINNGKDDPAGLIASELMKADMTATTKAITNTQRANSMVAIADSALGQVSSLLNDIRGLVTEAASTATMTYEQLLANQLQVNAALDSIDRIAKTTNYQGKLLLDGSMDFETKGLDHTAVTNLNIYEANFGTKTQVDIGIQVVAGADHGRLFYDKAGVSQDTVLEIVGNDGAQTVKIAGGSSVSEIADAINMASDSTGIRAVVGNEATAGQMMITSAGLDNDINLTALMTGAAAGNYTVKFTAGDSDQTSYTITEPKNGNPGILEFKLKMQPHQAPSSTAFDESYTGLHSYDISGFSDPTGAAELDIIVEATKGIQIRQVEYVASAAGSATLPGGVAATFDKVTGKLQIQYDATNGASNVTEAALKRAINAIDGLEYKGTAKGDKTAVPPTFAILGSTGTVGAQIVTGSPTYYLTQSEPDLVGKGFEIKVGGADRNVTVNYDGTAVTVTAGTLATYDDILAALNNTTTPPWTIAGANGSSTGISNNGAAGSDVVTIPAIVPVTGRSTSGFDGTNYISYTEATITGINFIADPAGGVGDVATVTTGTGGVLNVTYQSGVTYDTLINQLNGSGHGTFAWVDNTGLTLTPAGTSNPPSFSNVTLTGAVNPVAAVPLYLANDNPLDNGTVIKFSIGAGTGSAASAAITGTNEITVTCDTGATYDNILQAINSQANGTFSWVDSSGAAVTPPAGSAVGGLSALAMGTGITAGTAVKRPGTGGFQWTDAAGNPISGAAVNGGAVTAAFGFGAAPAANTALQAFLNTTPRYQAPIDIRANNAINIIATIPGTKFENTDIVYVKSAGKTFSETIKLANQNVYLSSDVETSPPKGWTIQFVSGTSTAATANDAAKLLTVAVKAGDDIATVLNAINQDLLDVGGNATEWLGASGTFDPVAGTNGPAYNFSFKDANGAGLRTDTAAVGLVGKTLTLDNVQLAYSDTPAQSAATIMLNTGGSASDVVKMRIVANSIGSQYNDVAIEFEQDNSFAAGDVSVVYDEKRNILHIRGQIDGVNAATYGALKSAIEANSPFHVDITKAADNNPYALSTKIHPGLSTAGSGTTGLTQNTPGNSAVIKTGQVAGDIGTDHQTLFITVADNATGNDVIYAFNHAKGANAQVAANFIVSGAVDNNGTGQIFDNILDANINVRLSSAALTGGNSGLLTDVTAKELVDFINNDAVLSQLFMADVARNQVGNGFLTLFDEAAYYGSTIDDNALQFLGPKDSPDVLFVIDGPNSPLGISFVDSYGNGTVGDDRPIASLNATHANAAFTVQAANGGYTYDDMIVRMIRLDNNHAAEDSYAQYVSGPSNAMAYCSINNSPTTTGTVTETGKFILYGAQQGDQLNDVDIVAKLDVNQTEAAKAYYDTTTKRLIITVNNTGTTLSDAVAAINNEGTFHAEYDYSFNTDPTDGTHSTGPGLETFINIVGTQGQEVVIGNTGNTGGHTGGVLEVYVGGKETEITADRVIETINSNPIAKNMFTAKSLGGTGAGTGTIDFRGDNVRQVIGADGKLRTEVNMVTDILGSDNNAQGYMIVHLATDQNGYSITTAKDLVKFFDELTPEQTRGISVSVVRPAGVDNLGRIFSYDSCGNLIVTELCDDPYGSGLLQPTMEIDDCDNVTYFPIEFFSYGENIVPGSAYGSVVAQGGKDASLDIQAKIAGPDFNGIGFKYVRLGDPMEPMRAEYDANNKTIVVYIQDGATAAQVKNVIETSDQTKDLFKVTLPGTGNGVVSLQDDYMVLKNGLYDAGYRGGASLLGAADADEHRLVFETIGEGSRERVMVRWINGGEFKTTDINGNATDTDYGEDMVATINGIRARADGRTLSLNTAMLKMEVILDEKVGTGDRVQFSVTGGGAVIQMGPDVMSSQQIRLGLQSVSTAKLGGASGKMYMLGEGGEADLITSDASRRLADKIVQEAILSIAQQRGRLGAIQRNTLEPNIAALQDSLVAISAAEAQISNADFAEESSKLTRAQILVQAGTRTLSIANQFPQYAASLLGG